MKERKAEGAESDLSGGVSSAEVASETGGALTRQATEPAECQNTD